MDAINATAIREHLERVTASPIFADSERLKRFLRFTVDAKLSQEHEKVKEFIIGREVFDRNEDYDPRLDPIVRVEARRLRSKLAQYYREQGAGDQIRIDYPKGSYLPSFDRVKRSRSFAVPEKRKWILAAAILVAATLALGYLSRPPAAADTMVAVLPASWLWPNEAGITTRDAAVAEALDNELANRQLARVIAWPVAMEYQHHGFHLNDFAKALGVSNVVVVSDRPIGSADLITAFLIDARTGEKHRTLQFVRNLSSLTAEEAVAHDFASGIAALRN